MMLPSWAWYKKLYLLSFIISTSGPVRPAALFNEASLQPTDPRSLEYKLSPAELSLSIGQETRDQLIASHTHPNTSLAHVCD